MKKTFAKFNPLNFRRNESKKKGRKTTVLRMEALEERQLLTASPLCTTNSILYAESVLSTQGAPSPISFTLGDKAVAETSEKADDAIKVTFDNTFEALARNENATIRVVYENTGDVDVAAPVLVLTVKGDDGTQGGLLSLDSSYVDRDFQTTATPNGFTHAVQFLASGDEAGVLKAGEKASVDVYWAGWDSTAPITSAYNISVGSISAESADELPLAEWKESLKPADMSDERWEGVWNRAISITGTTWGSYVQATNELSAYLNSIGGDVVDSSKLLGAIFAWAADSYNPDGTLESSVDAVISDASFTLSFQRAYNGSSPALREYATNLGAGWDSNWNYRVSLDSQGNATVFGPFGAARVFQPTTLPSNEMVYAPVSATENATFVRNADRSFTLTEQNGLVYNFSADGLLASVADVNGNVVKATTYAGRLTKLEDARGSWLEIAYNSDGNVASVVDSNGDSVSYKYNETGAFLIGVESSNGLAVSYKYDETGALIETTYADGTTRTYNYDKAGYYVDCRDSDGTNSVSRVWGDSASTILTYKTYVGAEYQGETFLNENGAVAKVVDAAGRETKFIYDSAGRLIGVEGNETSVKLEYDAAGHIVGATNANGNDVKFEYDENGRLTKIIDENGVPTLYSYDSCGRLTAETRVDGTASRYTYNADGTVASYTTRAGDRYDYAYDAQGNVVSVTASREANPTLYEYDARGNVVKIVAANGDVTAMTYDKFDNLTKIVYANGSFLEYGYDELGRQTSISSGKDYCVEYVYDSFGYLDKVLDGAKGGALLTDYDYDADGLLAKETRGNGSYTVYGYDALGYLTSKVSCSATAQVLASFEYTYDAVGNVATMETLDGTWSYGYDGAGQLTSALFAAVEGGSIADCSYAYTYDPAGNRLTETVDGETFEYAYDNMNRLLSDGRFTYTYDANGSMLTKTNVETGEVWTYAWNQDGALVSAISSTGEKYEYEYDALGNRTAVVHTTPDGESTRTDYLIDPTGYGDVAAELGPNGEIVATYAYGLGLANKTDATGAYYYAYDMLGSTAVVTTEDGEVANAYAYGPCGQTISVAETVDNPFQFVGEYGVAAGQSADLISMRARWYDPDTERFISEDPLGYNAGDTNLYCYCGNDYLNSFDPLGLGPLDVTIGKWYNNVTRTISTLNAQAQIVLDQWLKQKNAEKIFEDSQKGGKKGGKGPGGNLDINACVAGVELAAAALGIGVAVGELVVGVIGVGYGLGECLAGVGITVGSDGLAAPAGVALGVHGSSMMAQGAAFLSLGLLQLPEALDKFKDAYENYNDIVIPDQTYASKLALTLATDTSGSMGDDIANVKSDCTSLIHSLQDTGDYTVTVMRFCDIHENLGKDMSQTPSIISCINKWDTNYGDGGTENTFSMLLTAINQQSLQEDADYSIVFMTDEQGDDRGLYSQVLQAAQRTNTQIDCIYSGSGYFSNAISEGSSNLLATYADSYGTLKDLCEATGGRFIYSNSAENTTESIIDAIFSSAYRSNGTYKARVVAYGSTYESVSLKETLFDASQIVQYRWDFDDDGNFELASSTPEASNVWTTAGAYRVRVEATFNDGTTKTDTIYVDVSDTYGKVVPVYAEDGSIAELAICGWEGGDSITVSPGSDGSVAVCLDPITGKTTEYQVAGDVVVKGYAGKNAYAVDQQANGAITLYGGLDVDTLNVDASAASAPDAYVLSDGLVRSNAGSVVYSNVENVAVTAGSGADTFEVQTSENVSYTIDAGAPTAAPGDSLVVVSNSDAAGTFAADPNNENALVWTPNEYDRSLPATFAGFESNVENAAGKLSAPTISAVYGKSGISVSWTSTADASGYLVQASRDAGFDTVVSEITAADSTKWNFDALNGFSSYYFRVKALGNDSFVDSDWSRGALVEVPDVLNVPEWNLADYSDYTSFVLDASTDSNITATLYGVSKSGENVELKAWDYVGSEAVATIVGRSLVAEELTVTADAARLLGKIEFNGTASNGNICLDKLVILGTDGDDAYTVNSGKGLVAGYEVLGTGRIAVDGGAAIDFIGMKNAIIDGLGGNDTFKIVGLSADVSLVTSNGVDTLDFSGANVLGAAATGVVLNMNDSYFQYVISGQIGRLQLSGVFENVELSKAVDTLIGNAADNIVVDRFDSYSYVDLKRGGNNVVELNGQSAVYAAGNNRISIQGNYSVVNLASCGKDSENVIEIIGRNATVLGGRGDDTICVEGRYAYVNATQGGNDVVIVKGDNATIDTGVGNDRVELSGSNGYVFTGAGNDFVELSDLDGAPAKSNYIDGGVGNDVLIGEDASGNSNVWQGGAGDDIIVGSAGNDFIYAGAGTDILIGLEGADMIYGTGVRDLLISNQTSGFNYRGADKTARLELLAEAYKSWTVDNDWDATLALLGDRSVADGSKDSLYRGGNRNLMYANTVDDSDFAVGALAEEALAVVDLSQNDELDVELDV